MRVRDWFGFLGDSTTIYFSMDMEVFSSLSKYVVVDLLVFIHLWKLGVSGIRRLNQFLIDVLV